MQRAPGTTTIGTLLTIAIAAAALGAGARSQESLPGPGVTANDDSGAVVASLQLAPGLTVDAASYTINGPGGFTKTGTINVANSSTLTATIPGLPAGKGFMISLSATSTDGRTSCAGATTFDVTAHMTTAVSVH